MSAAVLKDFFIAAFNHIATSTRRSITARVNAHLSFAFSRLGSDEQFPFCVE
jgi:hypothetical protein